MCSSLFIPQLPGEELRAETGKLAGRRESWDLHTAQTHCIAGHPESKLRANCEWVQEYRHAFCIWEGREVRVWAGVGWP